MWRWRPLPPQWSLPRLPALPHLPPSLLPACRPNVSKRTHPLLLSVAAVPVRLSVHGRCSGRRSGRCCCKEGHGGGLPPPLFNTHILHLWLGWGEHQRGLPLFLFLLAEPVDSEFAEYAAEQYKGFPDEDNQIPGGCAGVQYSRVLAVLLLRQGKRVARLGLGKLRHREEGK